MNPYIQIGILILIVVYFTRVVPYIMWDAHDRRRRGAQSRLEKLWDRLTRRQCTSVSRFCTNINYQVDLDEINGRIEEWHRAHPMGVVTPEEGHELDELLYQRTGLLMARSGDLNESFSLNDMVKPLDDTEEWR